MTPPTKPEPVVEIVPSLTAPFLSTDPSRGGVLHAGQNGSWYPETMIVVGALRVHDVVGVYESGKNFFPGYRDVYQVLLTC